MTKKRELTENDWTLIQKVWGFPRILGYKNILQWSNVSRYKGVVKLALTVKPVGYDSKVIFLEANNCEQFEVDLDLDQANLLKEELERIIKLIKEVKQGNRNSSP